MSIDIDHLRAFRADDGAPDPGARAAARTALLERIEVASARPAPARRIRRPRPRIVVGGLGLTAAAAAVIALVAGLGSGGVQPATAAQALREASAVAAQGPDVVLKPGQYWYTRSESRQPGSDGGRLRVREQWVSPTGEMRWVVHQSGRPDEEHTVTDGPILYSFFPRSLSSDDVRALPVGALYERIERAGRVWANENGLPATDRTHEMFTIVGDWLRASPPLSSQLRAALYEVAARLPNVELLGRVRDVAGREGIGVEQAAPWGRRELVFDPDTAELLMERTVRSSGELFYEAAYLESGVVDSTHERP